MDSAKFQKQIQGSAGMAVQVVPRYVEYFVIRIIYYILCIYSHYGDNREGTLLYVVCPSGYHHNGFMATPELGHRIRFIYICI